MNVTDPSRGSVVWVDFDPTIGNEQAGLRPAIVVSSDLYNTVIPNLVMVLPVTTRDRGLPHHVPLTGPELKLPRPSFAMTEQLKSVDRRRIARAAGRAGPATLAEIDRWLRDHLAL